MVKMGPLHKSAALQILEEVIRDVYHILKALLNDEDFIIRMHADLCLNEIEQNMPHLSRTSIQTINL